MHAENQWSEKKTPMHDGAQRVMNQYMQGVKRLISTPKCGTGPRTKDQHACMQSRTKS